MVVTLGFAHFWLLPVVLSGKSLNVPFFVEQVPTITDVTKGIQVAFLEHEDFTMKCEAKGNPYPVFRWTKNGQAYDPHSDPQVQIKENSGTFTIFHNASNMSLYNGKYRCYVSNRLGTAISEETTIIVPGVPTFPKEDIPPLIINEGESLVFVCNPPAGIPPVHVYWMTDDLVHVPQDDRVSVGLDGNLYFANVKHSDSREDYFCCAWFPTIRRIAQTVPMALDVHPSETLQERKPKILTPHKTRKVLTVLKGEELAMECIAEGLPTPTITWYKEEAGLPNERLMIESHGKLLKIKDSSASDQGIYHCNAENHLGTEEREFHVNVEESPRWEEELRDSVVNVGSSVVLRCSASGKPKVEIRWIMNGHHLELGTRSHNHHITAEEVIIKNLQTSDSAVYQCEASNNHGTILTSASINVLDIAPVILTPKGSGYTAVLGQSIFLHCEIFAFPPADVSWLTRDGEMPSPASRYTVYENGTLHILKTEAEDAGTYTCWVSNARGQTALDVDLSVREPTRVFFSVENHSVKRFHNITLTCHVQCDANLLPSLNITWRKNGKDFSNKHQRIQTHLNTLLISNVTWEDEGTYTCTGHTSLDSMMAETYLIVQDVPNPPENLHLSEKQHISVRLSWAPGDSHNSQIQEFIVQAERTHRGTELWVDVTRVAGDVTSVILSLASYSTYRFRVFAVNAIGKSHASQVSERYRTPALAPDRNPRVIHSEADKSSEMTIMWEPLTLEEHNGPGLEYTVKWRRQGVDIEWHQETVKDSRFVLKSTPAFVPFEFSVQAVNEMGVGPNPPIHVKYSGEDTPDAAPTSVNVQVLNCSLVKVTWTRLPQDRIRGHLSGYKVFYWKTKDILEDRNPASVPKVFLFSGQKTWGIIPGLDPFSEHTVTVLAFNTRGDGPASSPVTFKTPEGVPEKPNFLRVSNSDQHSITLSWEAPRKVNGILRGYLLQHQIVNDTDETVAVRYINITNPLAVTWRIPYDGTRYKFSLHACNTKGCGDAVHEEGQAETQATSASQNLNTQEWFIGLMGAIVILTLTLLTACFVKKNKEGKYAAKEKDEMKIDTEQTVKEEPIQHYSPESDKKPLNESLDSASVDSENSESLDSLIQYSDEEHDQFDEDGSFIGEYTEVKDRSSIRGNAGFTVMSVSS